MKGLAANSSGDYERTRAEHYALRQSGITKMMRQVLILRGEDGFWVAECPSLPGCISQGETQDAALTNIKEAVEAYIGALEQDGLPVPEAHFDARLVTV